MMDLQRFAEEEAAPAPAPEQPAPAETEKAGTDPVYDLLSKKYGTDPGDREGLIRKLQADTKEPPSEEDRQRFSAIVHRGAGEIYDGWLQQAEQTRSIYPAFDLRQELADPRFRQLLGSRVDVKTAYEVLHSHEIIPAAMQYAARTVEQKLAASLLSSTARPSENGISPGGAVRLGSDVSHLSRKDYDEVCRRVARGEKVSFG